MQLPKSLCASADLSVWGAVCADNLFMSGICTPVVKTTDTAAQVALPSIASCKRAVLALTIHATVIAHA